MNFGSFWDDIYQVPMNSDAIQVSSSPYNLAYDPNDNHAVEGSYMFQHGSYYYLFYSEGICCGLDTSLPAPGDEYKIKVCRSNSATGGFVSNNINVFASVLINFQVDADGTACTDGGGTIVLESHDNVYAPGGQ